MILPRLWKVAEQGTGLALWTLSPQLSNRRRRLREKLPWGFRHPARVLPSSQHPMTNGVPRLGMPLSAPPHPAHLSTPRRGEEATAVYGRPAEKARVKRTLECFSDKLQSEEKHGGYLLDHWHQE